MEEKPFSCPVPECDMSFTNEDHLSVHKKKHELCLTLTPTTAGFKTMFVDETPTPTRFLNEILHGYPDNPFEDTFRKANSNGANHTLNIPESSSLISSLPDSEVLNTPSITLPSEPSTPITLKTNFPKKASVKDNQICSDNADTLPFSPEEPNIQELSQQSVQNPLCAEEENFIMLSTDNISVYAEADSASVHKRKDSKTTVVQTPVITSVGNSAVLKTNSGGVPTAVVVNHPSISSASTSSSSQVPITNNHPAQVKVPTEPVQQPVVQSVCVTPMVQLIIRLPDGQTMPVQIPMMASAATTSVQKAQLIAPAQQVQQVNSTTSSITKMKLKEIIEMNQKSSASKKDKGKPEAMHQVQDLPDSLDGFSLNLSPSVSPQPSPRPGEHGRKRRDVNSDPDEKRKKSLERNRAAAIRCREKRKQWITNLEKKADELARTNTQLQLEVTQLRNELAHLKTMLLAHKDCPVTLQQKSSGYDADKDNFTTIRIITAVAEDVQRVPNNTIISPLNAEFMEMDVNSVQSSSDASFTSDASEASYRER